MQIPDHKKIVTGTSALAALVLSVVSYQYLALALFHIGLSHFYELAATVPDTCNTVVADAAIAFTGVYDYIGLAVAGALLLFAVYLIWRLFASTYGTN